MTGSPGEWNRWMVPVYPTPRITLTRGKGTRVWDDRGRAYLDFIAGLAVVSTGHAHPTVAAAIREQAERLLHVSNLYATPENLRLAERLCTRTGYASAFFCNSGTEANEFAVKLAHRHARDRELDDPVILACTNSFHGRTLAALTLTGQPRYHEGFAPLLPGVRHVPFNDVHALESAFREHNVSALFVEFVQGEGGVIPASPDFANAARLLCDEHHVLLIADEVQTGVGRTGRFLAQEAYGVRADVTTLAKGLASGVPVGCVLTTADVAALVGPGDHGCTFGGNPLSSAAALATLDVIDAEDLMENAMDMGGLLRALLAERVPGVTEVRGLGLLVACAFDKPVARAVRDAAEARGLLVGAIGDHVIRLAPPLVVTEDELVEAAGILEKATLESFG